MIQENNTSLFLLTLLQNTLFCFTLKNLTRQVRFVHYHNQLASSVPHLFLLLTKEHRLQIEASRITALKIISHNILLQLVQVEQMVK